MRRRYRKPVPFARFGSQLTVLLADRGMSHAEFARLTGISRGWPSNMASGRQKPPHDPEQLAAWAKVLGLTDAEKDAFIELALLEHAPEMIRERYLSMKAALRGG